ncbi:MAG: hypothetical protein QOJ11_3371 [Frankiales bacterium]|jgi:hypothetical protein|nr:hypothetical protein [Frankiales bacterium]
MPSPTRALAALTTAVALSALTSIGASAAQAAAPAKVVVTPAQALAVVGSVARTLNKADLDYNTALQDTVETGAARVADDGDFRISKLVGFPPYRPFSYVGTRIYLPRQTHYPARFLALTHGKSAGQPASKDTVALVFQRASASSRWKLSAAVSFAPAAVPAITVGKDGYLPDLAPSTLAVTPKAMYPALLKAQGIAARGGKPSAAWAYNSLWRSRLSLPAAQAVDTHETFSSTHLAPICFASKIGALCLTSTKVVRLETSTAQELAAGVYWNVNSPDDRYSEGGVAQGRYSAIRTVAQRQLAVVIPRKQAKTKLAVTAENWSPISGRGTLVPFA